MMIDPERNPAGQQGANRHSRSCRQKCFSVDCRRVREVDGSVRIEERLQNLAPHVTNCVRLLSVRAHVRLREALRREIGCGTEQVAVCYGIGLHELIAPDLLERATGADLRGELEKLRHAIVEQVEGIYLEVHDDIVVRPGRKTIKQALISKGTDALMEHLRRIERGKARVSKPRSRRGKTKAAAPSGISKKKSPRTAASRRSVRSPAAATRAREFITQNGFRRSEFAVRAKIAEKTLRRLLDQELATHSVLEQVAEAMGITKAELLADVEPSA